MIQLVNPSEDFTFTATVISGATTNSNAVSSVTIEDNDAPSLSIADLNVVEGSDAFAEFTISLSTVSIEDISFDLCVGRWCGCGSRCGLWHERSWQSEVSTDGGVTWADATIATISASMMSVLARTPIVDDLASEPSEDFTFTATVISGATTNSNAVRALR